LNPTEAEQIIDFAFYCPNQNALDWGEDYLLELDLMIGVR
jgi:hypothetical protein